MSVSNTPELDAYFAREFKRFFMVRGPDWYFQKRLECFARGLYQPPARDLSSIYEDIKREGAQR